MTGFSLVEEAVRMSYEAVAGEDDDEDKDGTRWRTVVAVCFKAATLDSSSSSGGLDMATGRDGLCLSILGLLDDGLEPSMEGSSLGVVRHGDCTGQKMVVASDEQYHS
jgi:hypothetical protein